MPTRMGDRSVEPNLISLKGRIYKDLPGRTPPCSIVPTNHDPFKALVWRRWSCEILYDDLGIVQDFAAELGGQTLNVAIDVRQRNVMRWKFEGGVKAVRRWIRQAK